MQYSSSTLSSSLLSSIKKNSVLLSRHDQIRLKSWLEKLLINTTNNIWRQNRDLYLRVLNEMVLDGELLKPFNQSPQQGPLPKITIYDIPYPIRVRIVDDNGKSERKTHSKSKQSHFQSRKNSTADQVQHKKSVSKDKHMQHKKKIVFNERQAEFDDKENMLNYLKLFKSNKQTKQNSPMQNKTQKFQFQNQNNDCSLDRDGSIGVALLKKIVLFLNKNSHSLSSDRNFSELMKKIAKNGKKIGISSNETSMKSEETSRVQKCNKRIKSKLQQTDLNSLEFMNYLNSLA